MKYEIIIYNHSLKTESKYSYKNKDIIKILNDFTLPQNCTISIKYKEVIIDQYRIEYFKKAGMIENTPFTGYIGLNNNRVIGKFIYNTWDSERQTYIFRKMKKTEKNIIYI